MKRALFTLALTCVIAFCFAQSEYVNPFVGTAEHGHTFPGAIVPFGGVQLSPDSRLDGWDGCSGYHYSDNRIYGFSHTHLSGTGCSDYGDILVTPFVGTPSINNEEYACSFSHKNETATAGYYAVKLDNGIFAELTAGDRVGVHRYTFPNNGSRGVIIDLTHRDKTLASELSWLGSELVGYRRSEAWNPDQYCAFSMLASAPIAKVELYQNGKLVQAKKIDGTDCKAIIYFDDNVKSVTLKVAISAVDIKGAQNNQQEITGFDFNKVKGNATTAWNRELGKIKVETSDKERLKVFYTALYHCFTSPYLYSDRDGRYRGQDGKIHQTDGKHNVYTVFSLWDTYRALHPLLNIIDRKRTEDFLYTFMLHYQQGTMLPVWELSAHETWCMIGYHSVPVILDAYVKGMHPYDENEMLEAMVHSAKLNKLGRPEYAQYGYIPGDAENESISKTLEYAYDDWCIARFAELIGNQKVADEFYKRSRFYQNILDPEGFMHGKRNGGFITPFDPTEVNNFYTEANCWQYSTYVPHDILYYKSLLGGNEKMENFLDRLFNSSSKMTGRDQSDITGVIGQYAHGNEPSHHAAYLYNYVMRYDKTTELTRKIMTELYTSKPDGLCGNEDCGQTSAWYVLSSLGFYTICPGSNVYDFGYPMFDKATIQLENGEKVVITKSGKGDIVQDIILNQKELFKVYPPKFHFNDIQNGGTIEFKMTDVKTSRMKQEAGDYVITAQEPAVPYFSTDKEHFSEPFKVEIKNSHANDGTVIYYTLDGSEPAPTHGTLYSGPITVDQNMTIKAIAYNKNTGASLTAVAEYVKFNKDKSVSYVTKPDPQYYAGADDGLIDGKHGKANWRVGNWQGFSGDFEAVIDLQESKPVASVDVSCLEDVRAWIFFPKGVEILISDDGANYRPFGKANGIGSEKSEDAKLHHFIVNGNGNGRYLKIKVTNYGPMPDWHVSPGQQAWLFMDEISIK